MDEFPSNSRRPDAPPPKKAKDEKKIERVVQTEVVRRKKPLGRKFAETFVGGDTKGVWQYVLLDVMIPAAKDMVADATSTGIERMLFGDSRPSSRRGRSSNTVPGHVDYRSPFARSNNQQQSFRNEPRELSRKARTHHDFDEIILGTRVEAEEVIDRLFDLISRYESASVADLYELVGTTGSYTDDKWGWTDIRGAGVTRVRNGYLLDIPKPEPID